jgi:enoyl-CoA hydratase/carnithine racemase/predicted CoA-binding protein
MLINHHHYSDDYLKQILSEVKTIALVGASPRLERDSYRCMEALLKAGYRVFPVNPREAGNMILGQYCHESLASIGHPVDMVDIFRSSEAALGVTEAAIAIGVKVVWMQLDIFNQQAAELAKAANIKMVMDRCPKIELEKPYWTSKENASLPHAQNQAGETLMVNQLGSDILLSEVSEGILRLTLDDQKRRNALSERMIAELSEAFSKAAIDPSVRVIVLAAKGPAFCAGHDLKEINAARSAKDSGQSYFIWLFDTCAALMQLIVSNPKPVIAEVDGVATAAGCQLVASCDLAMAADAALFATPGVNIGLFCSTPMVALSRNVSNKHALEMLLTGDMIDAQKAQQIGLVNHSISTAYLTKKTMEMAAKIAKKSSMTLSLGKEAFYKQAEMPLTDAYIYASRVMVDNMLKHDAVEGIDAFIGKRAPDWQDK